MANGVLRRTHSFAKDVFRPMTFFTERPKTSLTLPRESSERGGSRDALEDDGDKRAAGAFRGGRQSAREVDGGSMPGVWDLEAGGLRVAEAISAGWSGGDCRTQSSSAAEPATNDGGLGAASPRTAA